MFSLKHRDAQRGISCVLNSQMVLWLFFLKARLTQLICWDSSTDNLDGTKF